MRFEPKTEKELKEENLWPEGTYRFDIVAAEDWQSKQKNDSIKLTINIYNEQMRLKTIYDYLTGNGYGQLKTLQLAKIGNLVDRYNAGEILPQELTGIQGEAKVYVKKSNNPQYPDNNAIAAYIVKDNNITTEPVPDDEIPF